VDEADRTGGIARLTYQAAAHGVRASIETEYYDETQY